MDRVDVEQVFEWRCGWIWNEIYTNFVLSFFFSDRRYQFVVSKLQEIIVPCAKRNLHLNICIMYNVYQQMSHLLWPIIIVLKLNRMVQPLEHRTPLSTYAKCKIKYCFKKKLKNNRNFNIVLFMVITVVQLSSHREF